MADYDSSYDSSPLMKSALEVLGHSIEHFVAGSTKDHRLAVLHLAQSVELAAKAVLVEHNIPIYDAKDGSRTLPWRQCMTHLAGIWDVQVSPQLARLDLLMDERNAMQHRFGTVDQLTIDYHLGSVFRFMEELLNREYGADLHEFLRTSLSAEVWRRCRYVKDETRAKIERAETLVASGDATSGLLEAFSALDSATQAKARRLDAGQPRSTLDALMKFGTHLAEAGRVNKKQVGALAEVYRLRNAAIHANEGPSTEKVTAAIQSVEVFLRALDDQENDPVFAAALAESLEAVQDRDAETLEPELSVDILLHEVAIRQLSSPPPHFVGFSYLATATQSRQTLQALVNDQTLIIYHVPNPSDPDRPTAAIRVNPESSKVSSVLEPELVERVLAIEYGAAL